jgi:hypothetical protein
MEKKANVKSVQFEAVIIRKDGTRENLGTISYWNKSWIKRVIHWFKQKFKGR